MPTSESRLKSDGDIADLAAWYSGGRFRSLTYLAEEARRPISVCSKEYRCDHAYRVYPTNAHRRTRPDLCPAQSRRQPLHGRAFSQYFSKRGSIATISALM